MKYKILVDYVSGIRGKVFKKNDVVNDNQLINIDELIEIKAIESIIETKPKSK